MKIAISLAALLLAGCAMQDPAASNAGGRAPEAWVDQTLAPDLARVLRTHPRFRGETLSLGLPGEATGGSSRLDRALEARLEEHLIAEPGLRIRPPSRDGCSSGDAAYRIGFVTSLGAAADTVQARVWDTAAAEWVAGVGGRWEGRLAGADARAAASPALSDAPPGTRQRPVPAADPASLAHALAARLECALAAAGLSGGTVTTSETGVAALTALRLSSRWAGPARGRPAWSLSVMPVAVDADRELMTARLWSDTGEVSASAYRRIGGRPSGRGEADASPHPVAAPRLTPVSCGTRCVGIRASGDRNAVLVAILAGRGLFSLDGCGSAPTDEGDWNVHLRGPDLSWASFYAIAADAGTRPALADLEARLPRLCGADAPRRGSDRAWLESLADLADEPFTDLAWNGLRVATPTRGELP